MKRKDISYSSATMTHICQETQRISIYIQIFVESFFTILLYNFSIIIIQILLKNCNNMISRREEHEKS